MSLNKSLKTLLMLCPDMPIPPDSGSSLDMHGHLQFFKNEGWHVVLAVCRTPEMEKARGEIETKMFPGLDLHLFSRNPRWHLRENKSVIAGVQLLINQYSPRLIWCEYADFARLVALLDRGGARLWFRSHNFELAHRFEKAWDQRPWRRKKLLSVSVLKWAIVLSKNLIQIWLSEWKMLRLADRVFFIGYGDLKWMSRIYPVASARYYWLPPFLSSPSVCVSSREILDVVYLGSNYSNNVNMQGALTLIKKIIPAVNDAMPNRFRFHFTGKYSKELLSQYALGNIILHGFIDNMTSFLNNMDISCVPISIGWGCKLKMYESLSIGIPVIGDKAAFRGIPEFDGGYIQCGSTQEYVKAFHVLLNQEYRESISRVAYRQISMFKTDSKSYLQLLLKELAHAGS